MGVETTVESTVHQPFIDTPARAPASKADASTRFALFGFVLTKKKLGAATQIELRRAAPRDDWWALASWHRSPPRWSLVLRTSDGSHAVAERSEGEEGDRFFELTTFARGKAPKEQS